MNELKLHETAARLLRAVYSQISPDYKSKYRASIWEQVESNVAACSQITSNLTSFLDLLALRFGVATMGENEEERRFVMDALQGAYGSPELILEAIQKNPVVCVTMLRVQKDEEKQAYAANR
jgi:hypothetical protein